MHYVERLIRRALAVPREQASIPFDPFEQVAPWIHDPPAPADVTTREATAPRIDTAVQAPAATTAPPIQHVPQAGSAPPRGKEIVPAPRIEPPAAPAATPLSSAETIRAALQPPAPPAEHMRPALAQADAFMRSIDVKTAPEAPPKPAGLTAPPDIKSPTRAATASPHEPVAAHRLPPPALVRPVPPRAFAPAASRPAQQRVRKSSPSEENGAQGPPPRRAAQPPAPERIVQTTIVVAPPSGRLDDLAHSSGIMRFGIGQG